MNQIKIKPINTLKLKRALYGQKEPKNLFPFDAADEYLLETLHESTYSNIQGPVIIFNDAFGALCTALSSLHPYHVSDSFVSQLSLRENLQRNQIESSQVTILESNALLPKAPALIIIKIPKSLSLLEHQIEQIKAIMSDKTKIIGAAKAQDIHTSTLKLFEKIGLTTTSLAKKKARLVFCIPNVTSQEQPLGEFVQITPKVSTFNLDGQTVISNYPNVFSRNQLDIGARFFIDHLPADCSGTFVDLGCGNGVIGLTLLKKNPDAKVIFTDESYMALESSRLNVLTHRADCLDRCEFLIMDALQGFPSSTVERIFCNPPFHQQNTLTDHIARNMFLNAKNSLVKGGELMIVGNRHLNYYQQLKKLFGNCINVAGNKKFAILKATKMV
ncbi:methyltransferase [Thorsellia kenyensis]|uniref:Ribosomal RNA large subunit methyltransferase G n=1 Tax=Thorsellia kenyensis TaxID=1549888 RepID=A0ABV6C742_9GAMM